MSDQPRRSKMFAYRHKKDPERFGLIVTRDKHEAIVLFGRQYLYEEVDLSMEQTLQAHSDREYMRGIVRGVIGGGHPSITTDPCLNGLIQSFRENPEDDATRHILADMFDDLPATQVEYHRIPNWLRLCWLRMVPPFGSRWRSSRYDVLCDMQSCLNDDFDGRHYDHVGTTDIAGLECFVSEPYARKEDAPKVFAPIRRILPCCAVGYARHGAHFRGVVRAIIFPPLVMPHPVRWKYVGNDVYKAVPK